MTTWKAPLVAIALVAFTATAGVAHPGHIHTIMGTVTDIDARAIYVKTPSGEVLSIAITDKTTVVKGAHKVSIADVQKGLRVVVGIGDGEDPLMAGEIKIGVAAPAPAALKK